MLAPRRPNGSFVPWISAPDEAGIRFLRAESLSRQHKRVALRPVFARLFLFMQSLPRPDRSRPP